jgi:hypothetical protein
MPSPSHSSWHVLHKHRKYSVTVITEEIQKKKKYVFIYFLVLSAADDER